jgi:Flp pilus assembly pilin Flp
MTTLTKPLSRLARRLLPRSKKGQTLVEYALVLSVLTALALGIFTLLSHRIVAVFSGINAILDTAQGS